MVVRENGSTALAGDSLLAELATEVAGGLDRYLPAGLTEPVIVALSGGKDSILLCLALRQLGLTFHPVVIDMGYSEGWAQRIQQLVKPLSLVPEIVDVRRFGTSPGQHEVSQIRKRLTILDETASYSPVNATPCTSCYSVKVIALQSVARRIGASVVALGQHMTDAIASLVKEALMHIDRWDCGNEVFSRARFSLLVEQFRREAGAFPSPHSMLLTRIESLVLARKVDTDEPPVQELVRGSPDILLVRPMFLVNERLIVACKDALKIKTEGSGCEHSASIDRYTPREMVHYSALRSIVSEPFHRWLADLVLQGVGDDGTTQIRARSRRAELLGSNYKTPAGNLDKL